MIRVGLLIVALFGSAEAFVVASSRPALQQARRSATPAMQLFGFGGGATAEKDKVPKGWKKVPSASRPGEFSYLNVATGKKYNKLPQAAFFDDEMDTTAKPAWNALQQEKLENRGYRSPQEAAGFGENGEDLANAGGALYLAFVPFLVFGLYYIFGNGPNPYSSSGGNF